MENTPHDVSSVAFMLRQDVLWIGRPIVEKIGPLLLWLITRAAQEERDQSAYQFQSPLFETKLYASGSTTGVGQYGIFFFGLKTIMAPVFPRSCFHPRAKYLRLICVTASC